MHFDQPRRRKETANELPVFYPQTLKYLFAEGFVAFDCLRRRSSCPVFVLFLVFHSLKPERLLRLTSKISNESKKGAFGTQNQKKTYGSTTVWFPSRVGFCRRVCERSAERASERACRCFSHSCADASPRQDLVSLADRSSAPDATFPLRSCSRFT